MRFVAVRSRDEDTCLNKSPMNAREARTSPYQEANTIGLPTFTNYDFLQVNKIMLKALDI